MNLTIINSVMTEYSIHPGYYQPTLTKKKIIFHVYLSCVSMMMMMRFVCVKIQMKVCCV